MCIVFFKDESNVDAAVFTPTLTRSGHGFLNHKGKPNSRAMTFPKEDGTCPRFGGDQKP